MVVIVVVVGVGDGVVEVCWGELTIEIEGRLSSLPPSSRGLNGEDN